MPLNVQGMTREFHFQRNNKDVVLSDPDISMSPDEVMSFYSNTYPELTTSTVGGPSIKDDKLVYKFKTTIGTKGWKHYADNTDCYIKSWGKY